MYYIRQCSQRPVIKCYYLAGFVSGRNETVYFNASGIIVNHNYTADFLESYCGPCTNLSIDIKKGVSWSNNNSN